MFAVVNQRRYRSSFWLSMATFALSVLLVVIYVIYTETKLAYENEDKKVSPEQQQEIMKESHYLHVLPIIAFLQLAFFTRRPKDLFGLSATVVAKEENEEK